MSTNATVTIKNKKGYETIYTHWDGYLKNNGSILLKHYKTAKKVQALIDLGYVSVLRESILCPEGHSFDNPAADCTVFYGRDRGEDEVLADEIQETFEECRKEEFNYLFEDGKWFVQGFHHDFRELTQELIDGEY